MGGRSGEAGLLYLTRGRGARLAAHAGGVDGFGRDQIQVLVVWDLVEPIAVFQQLDVQILIDLLAEETRRCFITLFLSGSSRRRNSCDDTHVLVSLATTSLSDFLGLTFVVKGVKGSRKRRSENRKRRSHQKPLI